MRRRKRQLSSEGIRARLTRLVQRGARGAMRGAVNAWRSVSRAMPPRNVVIVVVAGGFAFGLGLALGRLTTSPTTPLQRGYVTIEPLKPSGVGTAETPGAEGGAATADARLAATGSAATAAGGSAAPGADDAGPGEEGGGPTGVEEGGGETGSDGAGRDGTAVIAARPTNVDEDAGVVGPVPATSGTTSDGATAGGAAPGGDARARSTAAQAAREKMLMPVQGRVISEFGWRKHAVFADWRYHTGIDIATSEGIPVRAALSGKVVEVDNDRQLGLYVVLEHRGGLRTKYGHLESSSVAPDDQVAQGQSIGRAGSSGVTSGCYLHFEVIRGGKAEDPRDFL
ncbi:MAG: peptidoglycan DD-metalloendopeptidase family protein [Betaproteobacteria bacterium]